MYSVAIVELSTSPEVEAAALAEALGGAPYEHRLHLLGVSPLTVLRTTDRELAMRTLAGLRERGHGAVACDESAVVPSHSMLSMRHFRFESEAVLAGEPEPERLVGAEVLALLRATHRTDVETSSEVHDKKLSVGRALMTGGLLVSRTVTRQERSSDSEIQQVLYLFRRSGERPWLLRERSANYAALGSELGPSSLQNFATTVRRLRELAPGAAYDERLMKLRRAPGPPVVRGAAGTQSVVTSTASTLDLAAHLLALWFRSREIGADLQNP